MTIHTAPNFEVIIDTEYHLCCTSFVGAAREARARDEVRADLEAMHDAWRAGCDVVPYLGSRLWSPGYALDRAAHALLATEAGRPHKQEALERLPHVHYWMRGAQLLREINEGEQLMVCGLPGAWDVWGVYDTGQTVVGPDDLMAVYVTEEDDGIAFARVLLFTGAAAIRWD